MKDKTPKWRLKHLIDEGVIPDKSAIIRKRLNLSSDEIKAITSEEDAIISGKVIDSFCDYYHNLNKEWVLTGNGNPKLHPSASIYFSPKVLKISKGKDTVLSNNLKKIRNTLNYTSRSLGDVLDLNKFTIHASEDTKEGTQNPPIYFLRRLNAVFGITYDQMFGLIPLDQKPLQSNEEFERRIIELETRIKEKDRKIEALKAAI